MLIRINLLPRVHSRYYREKQTLTHKRMVLIDIRYPLHSLNPSASVKALDPAYEFRGLGLHAFLINRDIGVKRSVRAVMPCRKVHVKLTTAFPEEQFHNLLVRWSTHSLRRRHDA